MFEFCITTIVPCGWFQHAESCPSYFSFIELLQVYERKKACLINQVFSGIIHTQKMTFQWSKSHGSVCQLIHCSKKKKKTHYFFVRNHSKQLILIANCFKLNPLKIKYSVQEKLNKQLPGFMNFKKLKMKFNGSPIHSKMGSTH